MLLLAILVLCTGGVALESNDGECAGCNATRKGEYHRQHVLSSIRKGLDFDPDATTVIPAEILAKARAVVQRASHHADKGMEKKTIHVFAARATEGITFNFPETGNRIEHADFHVSLRQTSKNSEERHPISIDVFEMTANGEKGDLIASHAVLTVTHGHAHFKVRLNAQMIERIMQRDSASFIITTSGTPNENLVVLPGDEDALLHPLSLAMTVSQAARKRRDINYCQPGLSSQPCCVLPQLIDFEALSWDFMIAPRKIKIYTCAGHCNRNVTDEVSRDSILEVAGAAGHCCHPTAYGDERLIYTTPEGEVVDAQVKNIHAVACACS